MQTRQPIILALCSFILLSTIIVFADETEYSFEGYELCLYARPPYGGQLLWMAEFKNGVVGIMVQPQDGSGVLIERGTYTASEDSIFINITESDVPDRVGFDITTTWWVEDRDFLFFYFTNAQLLTMNIVKQDIVELFFTRVVNIEEKVSTWKEIKQMYVK